MRKESASISAICAVLKSKRAPIAPLPFAAKVAFHHKKASDICPSPRITIGRMKTPNEIAKLQKKHKNDLDERNRLLEAEKMIPFKKRRVRFGQDGFDEDMVVPREVTPAPPTPPKERTATSE